MLERLSERVGTTGSIQGEGIANLLGRPPFDPLTLVLRESGQNIWDARDRADGGNLRTPRMLVRLRTLDQTQAGVLQRLIESGDDSEDEPRDDNVLRSCLARWDPVRVLEICDFGTIGLDGETDPQSAVSRFVKFFFDFGNSHVESGDGGTYGYGRSSLYLAGKSRTILVDSLIAGGERRFMGARIGNSYQREINGRPVRFTGRHFWGKVNENRGVEPVRGRSAAGLAGALGMPERSEVDTGTTILIPWVELTKIDSGARIADILLHNLWPKLVSKQGPRAMRIEVEEEGAPVSMPDPGRHPVYSLFASALLTARTRDPGRGAEAMVVRRTKVTGHLAFAESTKRPPSDSAVDISERPERIFDGPVRHVALMRPSELVVRYVEFPGMREESDWVGVFLSSDDESSLRAFASSEPPAHDDWVPDRLKGADATLVRVTVRKRIPEAIRQKFGVTPISDLPVAGLEASLAAAADRFSERFISGDGSAPGDGNGGGGGGGGGGGSTFRTPVFSRLRADGDRRFALFKTALARNTQAIELRGLAEVEGAGKEGLPSGMQAPRIVGWLNPAGMRTNGDACRLDQPGEYLMEVEFRGDYAINVRCEPVEQ